MQHATRPPRDAALAIRGNPHQHGEVVPRADLQALGGERFDEPTSTGRAELAASLTSGKHPLAARVIVNRVWRQSASRRLQHLAKLLRVRSFSFQKDRTTVLLRLCDR